MRVKFLTRLCINLSLVRLPLMYQFLVYRSQRFGPKNPPKLRDFKLWSPPRIRGIKGSDAAD